MAGNMHTSAIALKPVTGEVNDLDYLGTVAPVGRWAILGNSRFSEMLRRKQEELSDRL